MAKLGGMAAASTAESRFVGARARRPPRGGGARREGAGFFGDERGAVVVGGVAEQGSAGQG